MLRSQPRLSELLLDWEERQRSGQTISAEELCTDCPELLTELRLRIRDLVEMDAALASATASSTHGPTGAAADATATQGSSFAGYEILREVGRGGMGVVYRAFDRKREEVVALKTVRRMNPAALYRFKQEFRAFADVVHPNLARLHELVSDGTSWFFTMELVDGIDFFRHVRFDPDQSMSAIASAGGRSSWIVRLREALRQLAEGVAAMHEAGRAHCDLKPSNVLVTETGRVVILDFGLATDLGPGATLRVGGPLVIGTMAYMAPEQAAGLPVSPATDWYSVGVMLYETLTGRLPFLGRPLEVLADKQRIEPPAPHVLDPHVPADLDSLCADLLRRDPKARPTGPEVLERLGGPAVRPEGGHGSPASPCHDVPLVGRGRHLEALETAFADALGGCSVVLYLHGRSGAGKTALAQRFLNASMERHQAVVLSGRCYEREDLPFKALDSLVDALARHLEQLPRSEVQPLLPRDLHALVRVFPAFRHVATAAAEATRAKVPDPQELRRRAFAALRQLLASLACRQPLILFIDDLQWGDLDSAALLTELLRPPDAPRLLMLGCYRDEDAATSPCLRAIRTSQLGSDAAIDSRELEVEALAQAEAKSLALSLLDCGGMNGAHAGDIARESGGNPYFIAELVRHVQGATSSSNAASPPGRVALDEVLWSRMMSLPEGPKSLLEVIAVSGSPIGEIEACRAAELSRDVHAALAVLQSGRFIRSAGLLERGNLEVFHDRVRETILARLPKSALTSRHRHIALALECTGRADPEVLAVHFRGAGEKLRAGEYFAKAGDRAAETLAFERAVDFYRNVLDSPLGEGPGAPVVRVKLADALANAGRGAQAAQEYLAAVSGVSRPQKLELQRRAAQQYLISGHVDQGLSVLRDVLAAVGMTLPGTPRKALMSLLFHSALIRLRGLRFRQRSPEAVQADLLARIDVCWAANCGLGVTDSIRGADFHARGFLLSLRAGERYRIARSLAVQAAYASADGSRSRRRTTTLLQAADLLARRVAHPHALGLVAMARGLGAYMEGLWDIGITNCDLASEVFRDRCAGVTWELNTANVFSLWSLAFTGNLVELASRRALLLNEARKRGDLHAEITLSNVSLARLAEDDPDGILEEVREAMSRWPYPGFHVQHYHCMQTTVNIHLYKGDCAAAREYLDSQWPAYAGSLLSRFQLARVDTLFSKSRVALAAATSSRTSRPLKRTALRCARSLERENVAWATAMAQLVRAGVAGVGGERARAVPLLFKAATAFDAVNMPLYAASARRRLGELLGGDEGAAMVAEADALMTGRGVRKPALLAAMFAPGFTGSG